MARWKLSRIKFGEDQLLLADGEERTIGRAVDNNVSLSSIVISRNHCVVKADKGKLTITDLKSSNGVYVGLRRIPSLQPYELKEREIIGLGWTEGVPGHVDDKEKYMFKVIKIPTLPDRIKFELDSELEGIKKEIEDLHDQPTTSNHVAGVSVPTENDTSEDNNNSKSIPKNTYQSNSRINDSRPSSSKVSSPLIEAKRNLKRKSDEPSNSHNDEGQPALRRSRNQISFEDDAIRPPTSHKGGQPALRNEELPGGLKKEGQAGFRRSRSQISYEEEDDVISISDSDTEMPVQNNIRKPALETVPETPEQSNIRKPASETVPQKPETETPIKEEIKTEKEEVDLEYFNIKQEYLGYDDEAIQIDSDSDSESEQWFMRLSQSSPGKPFLKVKRESKIPEESSHSQKIPEESSYSQIEDFVDLNDETDEDYEYDMISIPAEPPSEHDSTLQNESISKAQENENEVHDQDHTVCNEIDQPSTRKKPSETDQEMEFNDFLDDLIRLAEQNKNEVDVAPSKKITEKQVPKEITQSRDVEDKITEKQVPKEMTQSRDVVDGLGRQESPKHGDIIQPSHSLNALQSLNDAPVPDKAKRAQMIEPLKSPTKKAGTSTVIYSKHKGKSSSSRNKSRHSSSKRHISNSQKEERKKKLKELATKEAEQKSKESASGSKDKAATANVKVTSSNRGAFLTDTVQVVKPMKRISPLKSAKGKEKSYETTSKERKDETVEAKKSDEPSAASSKDKPRHEKSSTSSNSKSVPTQDKDSKKIHSSESKSDKPKSKHKNDKKENKRHSMDSHSHKANLENQRKPIDGESNKRKSIDSESHKTLPEMRIPLKSLKPLSGGEADSLSGKPISKVEPFPTKKVKKTVRFSDAPPKVHTFFIEEGNRMKRTSLAKSSLVDIRQRPTFSLEKLALVKILRWNPHWLVEQMNFKDPPPILGTSVPPVSIYHSFDSHDQYHAIFGDLILMEIWEGLSQGHHKARGCSGLQMRIAHVPPVPAPDRNFELFSLSVNVSVPNSESKSLPRHGEILNVTFGPENAKTSRFFYVHNVRFLPSPPKNVNTFCVISLHACYTDKMKTLKQGELMIAVNLGSIQKELLLFEAMENLSGSPLLDAVLRPDPKYFQRNNVNVAEFESNYIEKLNESQLRAVTESVTAALGDQPCINMVQGPPGTGKSAVISAIVMSYFNDPNRQRYHNRGKILICATSNAAVDELVLRLLKIRGMDLKREHRFKLVRVGRTEAMHKKALDVSSQMLAKRDAAARHNAEPARPGLSEEISHLEAKINMWKTQALDSKDPVRIAYCQQKIQQTYDRIVLLRNAGGGGGNEELRGEQLLAAERRIIDGADIIVTTLSSAQNNKMRGLKRRIALCIIDEAGQAIEPETLIPLTLDVTKITLVGDPQQLPGYICSQRAKKHGLGESLFSRITSCIEQWPAGSRNPVVLLNRQYRMHPDIVDYPNRAFYNNLIETAMLRPRPNVNVMPYLILSISSGDKGQGSCGGNEMESWGVARLVASLYTVVKDTLSLAVITPYNAHKELIKRNLRVLQNPADVPIEVNTVDSFQGQERDVVVVSLARSQGVGFLTDAGRMNVMLTRAKHALIVCLNPHAMIKNLQWRTLVEDAQRRNLFRTLPNRLCVGPSGAVDRDEILQYVAFQRPPQR